MKKHTRSILSLAAVAALLLTGCAVPSRQISTETAPPLPIVAEPREYDVKIYTTDPNGTVQIPDESVPLASPTELNPTPENPLTRRQAEALAIAHAGLTHNDVSFLLSKEDMEDKLPVIEVSFRSGQFTYEFEFAAENGELLSYEKEDIRKD